MTDAFVPNGQCQMKCEYFRVRKHLIEIEKNNKLELIKMKLNQNVKEILPE